MSHKDALSALFPLEIRGVFDADTANEGAELDRVQTDAEKLLREAFPDQADSLLTDYERMCALTPGAADTVQARRDRVVTKLREKRSLAVSYMVARAAALGFTITVEELPPNAEGHGPESIFIWRIHVPDQPLYYFRAGESAAGERLLDWFNQTAIEGPLTDVKPAHTQLVFAYT